MEQKSIMVDPHIWRLAKIEAAKDEVTIYRVVMLALMSWLKQRGIDYRVKPENIERQDASG